MSIDVTQIKHSNVPPQHIYEKARDMFGVDFRNGVVFTVGDTIHSQSWPLSPDLLTHEKTHVTQQLNYDGGKYKWWDRYFEDKYFRYSQEIEAYRNQYEHLCVMFKDRNKRAVLLMTIVRHLRTMYGFEQFDAQKIKADLLK